MSNSIGHNLIHHNLLALVMLEHQSKINSSCISGYHLFQVQANSQIRKLHITSKFWGKCVNLRKTKLPMGTNRVLSVFPQSVLATDPTSKPVDYEPPFFKSCIEQEAHSPWTKNPLKIERLGMSTTNILY
ncbi:alpha-glucan water dikinase, chloroplastic-like [Camellia sinensis]|uniref:alpha-glucan water dikinase, chloroplastic-like n=1 Tax=Camellia sinensis TaxID=4442 RepID=UPI0010355BD7|nr:alpha-glucan water dikinase, chloroplastic-like [Camellia sinensis]